MWLWALGFFRVRAGAQARTRKQGGAGSLSPRVAGGRPPPSLRAADGPLPTPTEAAEDAPDVPGVIAHLASFPDHRRHSLQGLQLGGKTPTGRACDQGGFQSLVCLRPQARLTARSPRAFQAWAPMSALGPIPAMRGGPTDFEAANNFRLGVAPGKQLADFQAASPQGRKVAPRPKRRMHAHR